MSGTIILKKNKYDIKENYNDNNFYVVLDSSQHRILKYYFINIIVAIKKE